MLYKVVNIADKKPFDNIANIFIYIYRYICMCSDRLFVCSLFQSSEEQQKKSREESGWNVTCVWALWCLSTCAVHNPPSAAAFCYTSEDTHCVLSMRGGKWTAVHSLRGPGTRRSRWRVQGPAALTGARTGPEDPWWTWRWWVFMCASQQSS